MPTLLIHVTNDDPILCEVDEMPSPSDQLIVLKNPRRKDGKDLPYIEANVTALIWPMGRVTFIEVMPSGEEEEIITFVRE
jgi:hypothetical protein